MCAFDKIRSSEGPVAQAVGLVVAYALLGASWLVMKSEDPLLKTMRKAMKPLLLVMLAIIAIISIWTPLTHPAIAARWFTQPNIYYLLPVPILVVLCSFWLWKAVDSETSWHSTPFLLTLGLIFLGFSGLGISIWP